MSDTAAAVAGYLQSRRPEEAVRSTLSIAAGADPDAEAEYRRLARQSGLPIDSVRDNKQVVQQRLAQPDPVELASQFPATTRYLSNLENARIAHDDVSSLTAIEAQFAKALGQGRASQGRVDGPEYRRPTGQLVGTERTVMGGIVEPVQRGLASGERGLTLLNLFPGLRRQQDEARAAAGMAPVGMGDTAVRLAEQQRQVERFPIPANVEAGMQAIGGAESFGEAFSAIFTNPRAALEISQQSLGTSLPVLGAAVAGSMAGPAGTAAGAGLGSFAVEYASTIQEVLAEKGIDGRDPLALARALENQELMAHARDKALKRGVAVAAFDALTAGVAGRLLATAKGTVGSIAPRVTGELAIQAGGGAAGEATAQAVTGEFKPGDILMEALGEMPSAIVEVPANFRSARERAQRAEAAGQAIAEIDRIKQASKLAQRDPDGFREFMTDLAEAGEAPAELFVDAQMLANTLNQSAVTIEQLRAFAPAVAGQLEAARFIPGADIRVPVAEFAGAPAEITTALLDHLRTAPDAMSRAEAQQFLKDQGARIEQDVQGALADQERRSTFQQSVDQVRQEFEAQLNAAGTFRPEVNTAYATMLGNYFAVQAERSGMTAEAFMQRYRLRATGTDPRAGIGGAQRLEQTGTFTPEQAQTALSTLQAAGLGNLQLVETIDDLPPAAQRKFRSEGAEGLRGLYDAATDTTYLVRQNIASLDEAFFVGLHEAFHRGLRKTVPEVEAALTLIHDGNERVRLLTDRYMEQMGIADRLEAIEEVLADMAGQGQVGDLAGWDQLLAVLKDAITRIAQALGVQVEITDEMVTNIVAGMRRAGMQDQPGERQMVELRKRESVLKSLLECLGGV